LIRARRKRKFHFPVVPLLTVALLAGAAWMFWPSRPTTPAASAAPVPPVSASSAPEKKMAAEFTPPWGNEERLENKSNGPGQNAPPIPIAVLADPPAATSDAAAGEVRLASDESAAFADDVVPKASPGTTAPTTAPAGSAPPPTGSFAERVASTLRLYQSGERIEARHRLNAMLAETRNPSEAGELRKQLTQISEETIFSRLRVPNDPLIAEQRVEPKENLIDIAARFDVPHQAILLVNPGLDPKKLRPGMDLKIPRGPFHLKISKTAFRLDLYLQDLYIRSFAVGLGGETDTPTGVWKIVDRQVDPTYYPPATAADKRVIPGKDPRNPLGSYYLKLDGIEGDSVGRAGFAIHGTNEPQSIGRAESLGCIRMLNEDVEYLYKLVRSQKSLVTISP
jgi:lipoprotein-anchoring transpeptidase ErfK/SrfK